MGRRPSEDSPFVAMTEVSPLQEWRWTELARGGDRFCPVGSSWPRLSES